jgi:dipeptidyl aminopeptidase/acylaminoacyl peptidase
MVKETLRSVDGAFRSERYIRNRQNGSWELHPELTVFFRDRVAMDPLGFFDANDPNKLFVSTNRGTNFSQIRIYDIATKTWEAQPAYSAPEYDVTSVRPLIDRTNRKLLGPGAITVAGPAIREVFSDDYWANLQRTLDAQFPGQQVSFGGTLNRELGRAIVTVSSSRHSPAHYILLNGRELKLLGRQRPWIQPQTLGETTFVRYRARDGLSVPAFLTLPPRYDKATSGRVPVIVLPHGGPWSRDDLDWDGSGWPQFLATRGYAVIQPQYRGSNGWGMELWKAGDREWGQKMSDDNDDAAAWLVSQGIGDSQRMAIFGYSYGGFAAIAASVRPNSPYRCAISGAGVADLGRLANLWGASRLAREYQGWTVAGMNPIENVRNANIPILLYHGDRDRQADTIHSRDFNRAMRGAGKPVEYHEIKDMWHQLPWWPEWHRETLGLIENYLKGPNCFGGAAPRT